MSDEEESIGTIDDPNQKRVEDRNLVYTLSHLELRLLLLICVKELLLLLKFISHTKNGRIFNLLLQ